MSDFLCLKSFYELTWSCSKYKVYLPYVIYNKGMPMSSVGQFFYLIVGLYHGKVKSNKIMNSRDIFKAEWGKASKEFSNLSYLPISNFIFLVFRCQTLKSRFPKFEFRNFFQTFRSLQLVSWSFQRQRRKLLWYYLTISKH